MNRFSTETFTNICTLLAKKDEDLAAIIKALKKGGNKNFLTKELPGLNHLFQECKTGSPLEYNEIEQTFSTLALEEILHWIQSVSK